MEFLIAPVFFMIALGGLWLSLKFSKYKQGESACCGGKGCTDEARILKKKKCNKAKVDLIKTEIYMK